MSKSVWGEETRYFLNLDQNQVVKEIDKLGYRTTGRVLILNSMENRVYEIEIEVDAEVNSPSERFIIAKFYRPGRWTREQILDEHEFIFDLKEIEIPVIAPIKIDNESLFYSEETKINFCIYPKKGGRLKAELNSDEVKKMGRLLARVHNIGSAKNADHRLKLDMQTFGFANRDFLLESDFLPDRLKSNYQSITDSLFQMAAPLFNNIGYQRVHGDCHLGNVLWDRDLPFLVDFDDMSVAPKVQDLWLIMPDKHYSPRLREEFLEAYSSMGEIDMRELRLVEVLRSLRMIHYNAWIAKRWEDQAFKRAFPQYKEESFWDQHYIDIREQMGKIQDTLTCDY